MFVDPTAPFLDATTKNFYCHAMNLLNEHRVDFLVGGAYAFAQYTGIHRHTKDFDIFVRRRDCQRAMKVLADAGYKTDLTFPHWLGKAFFGDEYIDFIYSSGNGICDVDDEWFEYATDGVVLGMPVKLVPAEEIIWPKSYIMERERFDGGDVVHLIKAYAHKMDWKRLLRRMDENWRVLLSHLILFGFIYPGERTLIPTWLMEDLLKRTHSELKVDEEPNHLCQGTILSRAQYLVDIEYWGYRDARVKPEGKMSKEEIEIWTAPVKQAAA